MTTHRAFHRHALAAAVLLALAGGVHAQLSSSTIQGRITGAAAAAPAGLPVVAVNKDNGNTYRTTTRSDGSYVLTGLAPGSYEIRVVGPGGEQKSELVTVRVGEQASLDLAIGAAAQQVVIVGAQQRKDVKTSEVGTNVSRAQIENLPQVTRNFLAFADLAPGVRFTQDPGGNVTLQNGAQNQDNVNVFIDGVGQKNYILRGGVSGLDSSRGNPFPQSAIAEYKVISQNYKAEFDQVSSAAITAVTKSGTNSFHGEAFFDQTRASWTALSPFEKEAKAKGIDKPDSTQNQYGFNLSGPIQQDTLHFFVAYEGKTIETSREVVAQNLDRLPANAGIVPSLVAMQGSGIAKFNEDLLFGRLDAQLAEDHRLMLTARVRRETDLIPEDNRPVGLSVIGNEKNRSNDETRLELTHEWSRDRFLNEARIGYEDYQWHPHSNSTAPLVKYVASPPPSNWIGNVGDVLFTGGSPDAQDRHQKGVFVQDDFTFLGLLGHVMKTGVKVKDLKFDLSGTSRSVDVVRTVIDSTTGLPYYDAATGNCLPSAPTSPAQPPHTDTPVDTLQCHIDRAIPAAGVSFKDRQFGIYFQDDWRVTDRLELNLGVRWDYEDNALNNNYVTPADRVAALFAPDVERAGITPAPGQTYAQSLAKGGINISDYISNGSSRKAFKGAWQPRLGFSYDLLGDKQSVVFGGWGRAYDRAMANHALDELQKNAQPGGEIWLIKNDHKMPYTDQFALGLRQALGPWNGEVGYTNSYAHNQFNWFGGNRDPNGGWGTQSPIDPLWGGPQGFGTLILGDFISQAKTQTVYFKLDKPYTRDSGWTVSATYTYSDGKTTNNEWTNNIFNWTYGRSTAGWNPSKDVERHRLVAAALSDRLLPWGIVLSGKMTLGSGLPRRIVDCSGGFNTENGQKGCVTVKGDGKAFRQFDLGIAKDVGVGFGRITVRADVLNLFNSINYGGFDDWGGGPGNPQNYLGGDNANLGKPNGMAGPMRTVKLTARYAF
ncbi:TonB-dependent receptor [Ideonella sp. BN130291]|uniref:TonB-dependent receptor n=1 Tax=Ideonella sp. BN130291 TaxID=3112940 RepID=UPI002E25CEBC|nr:TonB-dependent receptor [Ideonella sp. BN130291]